MLFVRVSLNPCKEHVFYYNKSLKMSLAVMYFSILLNCKHLNSLNTDCGSLHMKIKETQFIFKPQLHEPLLILCVI